MPASPAALELDDLWQKLRGARRRDHPSARSQAYRERARAERGTASVALDEAEMVLAHAQKFGRQNLIAAFVGGAPIGRPTPPTRKPRRAGQLCDSEEAVVALEAEIQSSQNTSPSFTGSATW